MICLYHNDPDGKTAGYLIRRGIEKRRLKTDNYGNKFIKMDYSKKFPFDKLNENEYVYIVDFSIKPPEMNRLLKITNNVIWIDHHISIINLYKNYKDIDKIDGFRFNGISGCMLTYLYIYFNDFFKKFLKKYDKNRDLKFKYFPKSLSIPMYLRLVNDWDVFNLVFKETIPFINFMNSYEFNPTGNDFNLINTDAKISNCVKEGEIILRYNELKNKNYIKENGFEVKFEGYNAFVVNYNEKSSRTFKDLKDKEKYDIFIVFTFDGKYYSYSIYTEKDDIDVSKIAQKYGGGGHKQASGFVIPHLIVFQN